MRLEDALRRTTQRLKAAGLEAPRREARLLIEAATGRDAAAQMREPDHEVAPDAQACLDTFTHRRAAREPMAYILGRREFYGLDFEVGPGVLIPRPDSETLIDAALAEMAERRSQPLRVLDLGVGSGCLLVTLLKHLREAFGVGVDSSPAALAYARRNALRHDVSDRSGFVQGDWTAALGGRFDLVVANPPYVSEPEHAALEADVREHEPLRALVAGRDGGDAYRSLAQQLPDRMAAGGRAVIELGAGQAEPVATLFGNATLAVLRCPRDLAGIERCLVLAARPEPAVGRL